MTTNDHYEQHLAPVYLWMEGGAQAALQRGASEIQTLGLPIGLGSKVVDLGAGFGMHAIPIARTGASVLAIDASALLLRTLEELSEGVPIRKVCEDLLTFPKHLTERPDLILCMGDTITHLPNTGAVLSLIENAATTLACGGTFVISLRDYSTPLFGSHRFIPVRSDNERLLTCFLEYEATSVLVHDIVQERTAHGWTTRVSHYRMLLLSIGHLITQLETRGFVVAREVGLRGMVRLIAIRR